MGDGLVDALRECGQEPYSIEDMEHYDTLIANFDLKSASSRAFLESLHPAGGWTLADVLWQLQRLHAIQQKLRMQRYERDARVYQVEAQHEDGLRAIRERIEHSESTVTRLEQVIPFRWSRCACASFPKAASVQVRTSQCPSGNS